MRPLSRGLLALVLAALAAVPVALAGTFSHPGVVEAPRPSFLRALAEDQALRAAARVTVRAPAIAGRTAWEGASVVGGIMLADLRSFWRFLSTHMTFDTRLADNPFFVAHREAAVAAERADERWDLAWAVPDELRGAGAWRAAVANLPPAGLSGARAVPEPGIAFIGWPPQAN